MNSYIRRVVFFLSLILSLERNLYADDEKYNYVYHPEYKVLYTVDNNHIMTKVNTSQNWEVPHTGCHVTPEQRPKEDRFIRKVKCGDKIVGTVDCTAKAQSDTKCEKDFGKVALIIKIKRYPTMATRRAIEAEYERENKIPY